MASNRLRAEFAGALLLDLIGAGAALLIATRTWQTIVTPRERPLADDVLHISGRTVDAAGTALALVALAGVVAVLATRGIGRRVIGAVLALDGVGLIWRAVADHGAVSAARARSLVHAKHPTVAVDPTVVPHVTAQGSWPVLSALCGVLVLAAGALILLRGQRWAAMSTRYDAPEAAPAAPLSEVDAQTARTRASASLWSALDSGVDPTGGTDNDPPARTD